MCWRAGRARDVLERVRVTVHAADGTVHKFDNLRLDTKADNRRIWLHQKTASN
ncbi:hypothetical protein ACIRD9_07855 [Streptomyces violaceus]|jgi:hypothetical protein|uniref:hypothetical protein n=1 Tax=Streptomyces violaceus TaxID=1936 RepID=UPI0037F8FAE0